MLICTHALMAQNTVYTYFRGLIMKGNEFGVLSELVYPISLPGE